jgi:2'-5' RNA ligase
MEPPAAWRRIFVALMLGAEGGARLMREVRATLGGEERAFRLPRDEGVHLTLVFLGDVAEERLDPRRRALAAALGGAPAPRLVVAGTGAFPGRGRARVLWSGVREEDGAALAHLREEALAAVEAQGFDVADERARPFRAHLTVARPRGAPRRVPVAFRELALAFAWRPAAVALAESIRGQGPARYRALCEIPLARGGSPGGETAGGAQPSGPAGRP